jgi:hypothetical protein
VEDEEEKAAKKKKKKKPKKKKTGGGGAADDEPILDTIDEDRPATPPPGSPAPEGSPAPGTATSPAAKKKKKKKTGGATSTAASQTSVDSQGTLLPGMSSTTSLPFVPTEQSAQSARSYVAQAGLTDKKEKVKTRGAEADAPPAKKTGLFGRFGRKEETPKEADDDTTRARKNWFRRLGKKTTLLMHQLLATPDDEKKGGRTSMKWDNFVKVRTRAG